MLRTSSRRLPWVAGGIAILVGLLLFAQWRVLQRRIATLEREIREAHARGDSGGLRRALDGLVELDEDAACRAALAHGFDGDHEVSRHAGRLLVGARSSRVQRTLLAEALRNENWRVRVWLVIAAGEFASGEPSALEVLHRSLWDSSQRVVLQSLKEIRRLKHPSSVPVVRRRFSELGPPKGRLYWSLHGCIAELEGRAP